MQHVKDRAAPPDGNLSQELGQVNPGPPIQFGLPVSMSSARSAIDSISPARIRSRGERPPKDSLGR